MEASAPSACLQPLLLLLQLRQQQQMCPCYQEVAAGSPASPQRAAGATLHGQQRQQQTHNDYLQKSQRQLHIIRTHYASVPHNLTPNTGIRTLNLSFNTVHASTQ